MYITWYGFGRMLIEGLRTDSLYVGVFRISQVIGFLCFVVGGVLLIINLTKARKVALEKEYYEPSFMTPHGTADSLADDATSTEEDNAEMTEEQESDITDKLKNLFGDN